MGDKRDVDNAPVVNCIHGCFIALIGGRAYAPSDGE